MKPNHIISSIALLLLASCSSVSVTRTPNGTVHAGATSFVGKQAIKKATVTTIEGDRIEIEGYSTANPDPEATKTITNGILIKTGMEIGQELTQPVANAVGAAIPTGN